MGVYGCWIVGFIALAIIAEGLVKGYRQGVAQRRAALAQAAAVARRRQRRDDRRWQRSRQYFHDSDLVLDPDPDPDDDGEEAGFPIDSW